MTEKEIANALKIEMLRLGTEGGPAGRSPGGLLGGAIRIPAHEAPDRQ